MAKIDIAREDFILFDCFASLCQNRGDSFFVVYVYQSNSHILWGDLCSA